MHVPHPKLKSIDFDTTGQSKKSFLLKFARGPIHLCLIYHLFSVPQTFWQKGH